MQKLADALSAAGFTTGEIEKIFWRNVMRVYEEVLLPAGRRGSK